MSKPKTRNGLTLDQARRLRRLGMLYVIGDPLALENGMIVDPEWSPEFEGLFAEWWDKGAYGTQEQARRMMNHVFN